MPVMWEGWGCHCVGSVYYHILCEPLKPPVSITVDSNFCHHFVNLCVWRVSTLEYGYTHMFPCSEGWGACVRCPLPLPEDGAQHFQLPEAQVCLLAAMLSCFCGCWASFLTPCKQSYSPSLLPGPIVSSFDDKFKFCCVLLGSLCVSDVVSEWQSFSDCLLSSNRGLLVCAYVCMSMPLMSDIELGDWREKRVFSPRMTSPDS